MLKTRRSDSRFHLWETEGGKEVWLVFHDEWAGTASGYGTTCFAILHPEEEGLDRGRFANFSSERLAHGCDLVLRLTSYVERSTILNEIFDWIGERQNAWSMTVPEPNIGHPFGGRTHIGKPDPVPVTFAFESATAAIEFALRWGGTELP